MSPLPIVAAETSPTSAAEIVAWLNLRPNKTLGINVYNAEGRPLVEVWKEDDGMYWWDACVVHGGRYTALLFSTVAQLAELLPVDGFRCKLNWETAELVR